MSSLSRHLLLLSTALLLMLPTPLVAQEKTRDSELLGRAIDYFQGGKYREALNIFQKLDKQYRLNPRFTAYMGVCYYYEWEYELAIQHIDSVLPQLEVFAPHERALYYYISAESHFALQQYEEALPMYEHHLLLCYDTEKGDSFYRLGFCHLFLHDIDSSYESFKSARSYYQRFGGNNSQGRDAQIQQMIKGLEDKIIRRRRR